MMNARKQQGCRLLCIVMTSILLCGCKQKEEIPKLIEPAVNVQSFRPVAKQSVGNTRVMLGHFVGKPYCHFFKRTTYIENITCDIGDYVNQGDVLAYADVEKLQDELEDKRAALTLCIAEHEIKKPIHECTIKSLQSQQSACNYLQDTDGANKIAIQIKEEYENDSYEEQFFHFQVENYNKEIAEIEELITDGTIKAKASGYVTYIKDTATGNRVGGNENVVIVTDNTDVYIESEKTTKEYSGLGYKDFDVKYAMVNGQRKELEEYPYTSQETVFCNAQTKYPFARFKLSDGTTGEIGDSILLYFILKDKQDVLAVGMDSTNTDEQGNYVYVKKEDGNLEKRYFEAGIGDSQNIEVKSGLKEGELVLFTQQKAQPVNYEPYTVSLSDYTLESKISRYELAKTINTSYTTPCRGKIREVLVATNQEVKKGDPLVVIDSGGGEATLLEAENKIKHATQDYQKYCKDTDKQIGEMKEKSLRFITDIEMAETEDGGSTMSEEEIDAIQCQRGSIANEVKILEQQKELTRLEYEENLRQLNKAYEKLKKNNNGAGEVTVVATSDGVVTKMYAKKGIEVDPDGESAILLSCGKQSTDKLMVQLSRQMNASGSEILTARVGDKITFTTKDKKKTYEGTCIGSLHDNAKNYAFTEEDKVYVTSSLGDEHKNSYIVAIDESEFPAEETAQCEGKIQAMKLKNVMAVPDGVVFSEKEKLTENELYFVWKIVDEKLVKQYVTTGTAYSIGNNTNFVIINGLSEGDVVARELKTGNEENDKQ